LKFEKYVGPKIRILEHWLAQCAYDQPSTMQTHSIRPTQPYLYIVFTTHHLTTN